MFRIVQSVIRRLLREYDLANDCIRRAWLFNLSLLAAALTAGAQTHFNSDAVRLNNRGVALMGQQFTEKAEQSFAESFQKDPKLAQAAINEGIALLTLQKVDEGKKVLNEAIARDATNPQAWYNLG